MSHPLYGCSVARSHNSEFGTANCQKSDKGNFLAKLIVGLQSNPDSTAKNMFLLFHLQNTPHVCIALSLFSCSGDIAGNSVLTLLGLQTSGDVKSSPDYVKNPL
jgi:hypothetical protein